MIKNLAASLPRLGVLDRILRLPHRHWPARICRFCSISPPRAPYGPGNTVRDWTLTPQSGCRV